MWETGWSLGALNPPPSGGGSSTSSKKGTFQKYGSNGGKEEISLLTEKGISKFKKAFLQKGGTF